jgi:hypothetical protein
MSGPAIGPDFNVKSSAVRAGNLRRHKCATPLRVARAERDAARARYHHDLALSSASYEALLAAEARVFALESEPERAAS